MIEIPVTWILSALLGLGGVIATLAGVIWRTMQGRLEAQDRIIDGLRADIERMSKGCGIENCNWRAR